MELLVAVAGLFVALYAVIPRERQMELSFRIGPIEWSVAFAGLVPILYLEYYPFFVAHGLAPDLAKWPPGFTPTSVKPLFVLFFAVFIGIRSQFARLGGVVAVQAADPAYLADLHGSFGRLRHEYQVTHLGQHVIDLAHALGIRAGGDV